MLSGIEQFKRDLVKEISEKSPLTSDGIVSVMQALESVGRRYIVEPTLKEFSVGDNGLPAEVNEYLDSCNIEGQSDGTIYNKRKLYGIFFSLVVKPLSDIKVVDIRTFLASYKHERHVSDRSLEFVRTNLSALFDWLVNNEYIVKNPVKLVNPIKYEKKERKSLNRLELERLRSACRDKYELALIDFFASTGCRAREVSEMLLENVNFESREVHVINGKGKKDRVAYLSDRAIVSLQDYLSDRGFVSKSLFLTKKAPYKSPSVKSIRGIIVDVAERCKDGITVRVTPHVLRHTYATLALNAGMPIEEISASMGHSSIDTTLVYAKVSNQRIALDHQKFVV